MNREEIIELAERGEALLEDKQFEEALALFERIIGLAPMEPIGYMGKAQALVDMGHEDEGLAVLDGALARQPEQLVYLYTKLELLECLGRYDEAKVAYRQMAELDPRRDFDPGGEGVSEAFQYDEAQYDEEILTAYQKAAEQHPQNRALWLGQIDLLEKLGRSEEALAVCDQAVAKVPGWLAPWYKKAELLNQLGRGEEAEQAAQRIRALVKEKEARAFEDEPGERG